MVARAEEAEPTLESPLPATPTSSAPESAEPDDDWPGGSGYAAMLGALLERIERKGEAGRGNRPRNRRRGALEQRLFVAQPWLLGRFLRDVPHLHRSAERASRARELGYADSYPRFVAR